MTNAPAPLCCTSLSKEPIGVEEAKELASAFKALSDPIRLQLVSIVASADGDEVCACDLPALVDRSQPTVSHHLSTLTDEGLLNREQRGKWAWFSLNSERLEALGSLLI